jgi:hypothetical protein
VTEPPPRPWGWFGHPQTDWFGGGRTTSMAKGVVRPPPNCEKKNANEKWVGGFWGWSDRPQGLGVALSTLISAVGGGPATPKSPQPIFPPFFFFFFFFFFPFGLGVASTTPYSQYGMAKATPRPLGVVRPPPKAQNPFLFFVFFFFGNLGVAGPPPKAKRPPPLFSVSLFFFFFFFFFLDFKI